jgi:thiamine-monophosphate kinase
MVGGDTSTSSGPLFVDTTVLGECPRGQAIKRSGARIGDRIFVTGSLGGSTLGLNLLRRGFRLEVSKQSVRDESDRKAIQEAILKHLSPEPRLKLGAALGDARLANSMIDISDGLSTDLSHILESSGVGAILNLQTIPVAEPLKQLSNRFEELNPIKMALHGGEEYELLFTASSNENNRLSELADSVGVPITAIGEISSDQGILLEDGGETVPLEPEGFEHHI